MKKHTFEDNKHEAIKFAESGKWKEMTDYEIVELQLFRKCLGMDFGRFHEACEKVFGFPIFTHMFGSADFVERLKKDFKENHEKA